MDLPSCNTGTICGHKSATQIFQNVPCQYGEGEYFLSIERLLVLVPFLANNPDFHSTFNSTMIPTGRDMDGLLTEVDRNRTVQYFTLEDVEKAGKEKAVP